MEGKEDDIIPSTKTSPSWDSVGREPEAVHGVLGERGLGVHLKDQGRLNPL